MVAVMVTAWVIAAMAAGVSSAAPQVLVPDPSVDGVLADDGSVEVVVTVANPADAMAVIAVDPEDLECTSAASSVVEPASVQEVTVRLDDCAIGVGQVMASLSTTLVRADGTRVSAEPTALQVSITKPPAPPWSLLLWFLSGFAAVLTVFPPYLTWLAFPEGNRDRGSRFRFEDLKKILEHLRWRKWTKPLGDDLPGITKDWSLDSWAPNVGLGASLFTGVFAAATPAGALLGTGAAGTQAVITVAAAISAAVVASAPLWLTILKRRTEQNDGFPRDNTILGVLVASFWVYFGTVGLIATLIALLRDLAPLVLLLLLGVAASLLLVGYAWKSLPQTLALGSLKPSQPTPLGGWTASAASRQARVTALK